MLFINCEPKNQLFSLASFFFSVLKFSLLYDGGLVWTTDGMGRQKILVQVWALPLRAPGSWVRYLISPASSPRKRWKCLITMLLSLSAPRQFVLAGECDQQLIVTFWIACLGPAAPWEWMCQLQKGSETWQRESLGAWHFTAVIRNAASHYGFIY